MMEARVLVADDEPDARRMLEILLHPEDGAQRALQSYDCWIGRVDHESLLVKFEPGTVRQFHGSLAMGLSPFL